MKNKMIKEETFLKTSKKYDLVWIGEIHGIKENYRAYKEIISKLSKNGFKNIIWEIKSDFSEKSNDSEDGRINSFAVSLLKWMNNKIKTRELEKLTFLDAIKNKDNEHLSHDEIMAIELIDNIENKKNIIITGNFHMGGPLNTRKGIEPCLNFVKSKTNLKILKIGIKYAGGHFYNYGTQKLPKDFYFGDKENLEFGTITKNRKDNTFFFHVGRAHPVFKDPTTRK